jgi:PAS domain S-box-containing protein
MNDDKKTKAELTAELAELKQSCSSFEYESIINTTLDGFWEIDNDGRIINVNDVCCKMTGYTRKELLGMSLSNIEAEESSEELKTHIEQVLKDGHGRFEAKHRRKDGSIYDVEISTTFIKNSNKFIAFVREISERKNAEKILLVNQNFLEKAQELGSIGSWELDVNRNKLIWSGENYRVFGLPEGTDLSYEIFLSCVHPEDRDYVDRKWTAAMNNEPYDIEHRLLVHGKVKWVREKAELEFDSGGNCTFGIGFTQDITERKQTEKALIESESILKNIVDNSSTVIFLKDLNGKYIRINRRYEELFHITNDEIFGKTDFDIFPEHVAREARKVDKNVLKAGGTISVEEKVPHDDGMHTYISVKFPLLGSDGKPYAVCGISTDITKRKKTEKALLLSEERYRLVNDSSYDFIFSYDMKSAYTSANKSYCKALNISQKEIIGKHPRDLGFTEDKLKEWDELHWQVKETNKSLLTETSATMPDKEIHYYDLTLNPIHDSSGNIIGISGIARDITDRKKAQERLRQSEERYRLVNDSSIDSIYSYDIHGCFKSANKALCDTLHLPLEDIVGKSHTDLGFPDKIVKEWDKLHRQVIQNDQTVRCETSAPTPDGKLHYYEVILNPIHDSTGTVIGISGITRDINDRKQLAEERAKASKLESIGILAGGIAHDFNNILAAILGNISLAKLNVDSSGEDFELLTEAENATVRATKLTQQLLTFAKGGAPVKEISHVTEFIKETVSFSLRGSNVKYRTSFAPDIWAAEVDKAQIEQVIGNLVINAKQAMPEGGMVNVRAENMKVLAKHNLPLQNGNYIKISVSDNGEGIHPEDISKIFDPYFTSKTQGTGLGLATSYSIIHRHKGHIEVKSEIEKGTTFNTYLPASSRKAESPKKSLERSGRQTGKILLMDDNETVLKVVKMMLKSLGNEVETAIDGTEALKVYRKALKTNKQFDIVIMDLTIPGGMGGAEAIAELLKIDPNANAVVSSGYSNDPVISNFRDYGFKGFIPKPYKIEELKEVLYDLLK